MIMVIKKIEKKLIIVILSIIGSSSWMRKALPPTYDSEKDPSRSNLPKRMYSIEG